MVKREWKIGDVTITVEAPETVTIDGASVRVRTADRAEFLRAVDAVGGLTAVRLPEHEQAFSQAAVAYSNTDDPTEQESAYVAIYEPPRESRPEPRPHPFFSQLAERREREAARGPKPGQQL